MIQNFAKQMLSYGSDPLLWREHAIYLKIAADALLPHYYESIRERPAAPDSQIRKFAYHHGYLVLIGLAIENAVKGLCVTTEPLLISTEGKMKKILDRGGHGIKNGVEKYLTLNSDEIDVVTRLEEFLVWAAKYPIPMKVSDLERAEKHHLRSHISTDPEILDRIFNRLMAIYPTADSPYSGGIA